MSDLEKLLAEATPGPWRTHTVDETSIVGPDGSDVATTCDSSNTERSDAYYVEYERMEADARLIALAPSLAAALGEARKALSHIDAIDPEEHVYGCSNDALRGLVILMGQTARAALSEIEKLRGDSK